MDDVWCTFCGCLMKQRKGKYGEFFGCTGYPKCMKTRSLREVEKEQMDPRDYANFDENDDEDYRALYGPPDGSD